ncbi:pentapeptide repeat-containing protein [Microcoleus sp. herbarium5]|uniref:pentapeptide repeat-containing protein n=1 Tax=Microcoleus sp. herbarium5 TaxID=3055434 RepID=UPI002FD76C4C
MTDLSIRKKKKITITASSEGVKIADNALIRLGFNTHSNFAKSQLLARSTVTKFFRRQPLQLDSFKKICQELKLDWTKIAELSEEKPSHIPGKTDYINPYINEGAEKMLTPTISRQVTVRDKNTNTIKAEIKLIGDINSFRDSSRVEFILREFSGDTITIIDIKEGSIRLTVEGSQEDIERLVSRIKSGELKQVSGFPVEYAQILSESSEDDESNELNNKWHLVKKIVIQAFRHLLSKSSEDDESNELNNKRHLLSKSSEDDESNELNNKWHLVREIVIQGIRHRDLSGVDLSDADLSGANLSGADLSGANLSGADLSDADLSGADLSDADLSGAYLIDAYLSRAYLIRADLSGANLSGAHLSGAYLIDAYLIDAYLIDAYLSGAYLIRADLRSADLRSAYLIDADLRSADLRSADLIGADLSSADLSGANLSETKVETARFSSNLGISESMKQDLIKQGAIFEDSPGDRSKVPKKV